MNQPTPEQQRKAKALVDDLATDGSVFIKVSRDVLADRIAAALAEADIQLRHERDCLADAIAQAAIRVGIIDGSMALTGPQLILLCNNLAEAGGPSLAWSNDIPRSGDFYQAGWYFQRRLSNHALQMVEVNMHGRSWIVGKVESLFIADLRESGDYEWLGPIKPERVEAAVLPTEYQRGVRDEGLDLLRQLVSGQDA